MELKAELLKPYTEKQRNDFIAIQNQVYYYKIIETDTALQAWGKSELEKVKEVKYKECLDKAYLYQQNGIVEYKNCEFEMSDSNRKNLSDTEEALKLMGQTSTIWNDKEDNLVELTIDDIQYIRLNLILATIQQIWIEKYPAYKQQIEEAQTVEDVLQITIDYSIPVDSQNGE